jgi:hypothetical protein
MLLGQNIGPESSRCISKPQSETGIGGNHGSGTDATGELMVVTARQRGRTNEDLAPHRQLQPVIVDLAFEPQDWYSG